MQLQEIITRKKFNTSGCLRFPEILMQFDVSQETDNEVTAHLRNCPRCWQLFNRVVYTDAELLRETVSELSTTSDLCAELEVLFYDDMFASVRDYKRILSIQYLLAEEGSLVLSEDERIYLEHFLNFLSSTSATARERATLLRAMINGARVYILEGKKDAVIAVISRKPSFTHYKKQIAAGSGDTDFATGMETLSNGLMCEITYLGGGRKTELKLNDDSPTPPVLEYYPLPDGAEKSPLPFHELQ
jgi:hypothetical protein